MIFFVVDGFLFQCDFILLYRMIGFLSNLFVFSFFLDFTPGKWYTAVKNHKEAVYAIYHRN